MSVEGRVKDHFGADAARFDAIYDDAKGPLHRFIPRIPLPRRIAATHYFNLGATEGRLRRLLRDFRFAPMSEVLGVSMKAGAKLATK